MASSGSKKYHWTDVQLYALGLAGQNASNQDKTTDVQLGMEIANTYKQHLQRALADMLVSWEDVQGDGLVVACTNVGAANMRADPGTVNAAIPRQGGEPPSLPEHKCVYFMGQDFHMQCTTSKLTKAPGKPLLANLCSVDRSSSCVLGR